MTTLDIIFFILIAMTAIAALFAILESRRIQQKIDLFCEIGEAIGTPINKAQQLSTFYTDTQLRRIEEYALDMRGHLLEKSHVKQDVVRWLIHAMVNLGDDYGDLRLFYGRMIANSKKSTFDGTKILGLAFRRANKDFIIWSDDCSTHLNTLYEFEKIGDFDILRECCREDVMQLL